MNWGKKILIVYLVFVAGIVGMVLKSSLQKTDLVTTDYYAKELKYQDKIDEINRVEALSAPVEYSISSSVLIIKFPKDFTGKNLSGETVLYCPSDEKKDIQHNFSLRDEPLKIELPAATTGVYQLQISWREGAVSYYFEKKIII